MSEIKQIDGKIVQWKIIPEGNGKISNIKKERPKKLDGKTYALKSQLLKSTLYITINNIDEGEGVRPFEIFFNTRDTAKFVELQIITRLISAIFRRSESAVFIVDELKAVANPENTGYFRPPRDGEMKGMYIPSIFYEIGEIIEEHLKSLGVQDPRLYRSQEESLFDGLKEQYDIESTTLIKPVGKRCPQCHEETLTREAGCDICHNCGYSKCG